MAVTDRRFSPQAVLAILGILAIASVVAFMTIGARGSWSFILAFRGEKLAGLALVAFAISVSTVLFQTITNNRILTPSIMGFDALYVLLQTVLVFSFGATAIATADARLMFFVELATMLAFTLALYRVLFAIGRRSLHLLLLIGIVFGVLFRSISGLLQRLINPNDFVVLQDSFFASFNGIDNTLLGISYAIVAAVCLALWRYFHRLDVMALGRETAICLGVNHRRTTYLVLTLVSILVAVSTALVGPVTFFGLLVANLAYLLMPTARHIFVLPAAFLISLVTLVGGQVVLEQLFSFTTALSIVIDFAGGLFFIFFLLRGRIR